MQPSISHSASHILVLVLFVATRAAVSSEGLSELPVLEAAELGGVHHHVLLLDEAPHAHAAGVLHVWLRLACHASHVVASGFAFPEAANTTQDATKWVLSHHQDHWPRPWTPALEVFDPRGGKTTPVTIEDGFYRKKVESPVRLHARLSLEGLDGGLLLRVPGGKRAVELTPAQCRSHAAWPAAGHAHSGLAPMGIVLTPLHSRLHSVDNAVHAPRAVMDDAIAEMLAQHVEYHVCVLGIGWYVLYLRYEHIRALRRHPRLLASPAAAHVTLVAWNDLPLYSHLPSADQALVYNHALLSLVGTHRAAAFIDLDEYMVAGGGDFRKLEGAMKDPRQLRIELERVNADCGATVAQFGATQDWLSIVRSCRQWRRRSKTMPKLLLGPAGVIAMTQHRALPRGTGSLAGSADFGVHVAHLDDLWGAREPFKAEREARNDGEVVAQGTFDAFAPQRWEELGHCVAF